jgi:hypothetical protein
LCQKTWCGACYISDKTLPFFVVEAKKEEDERLVERWASKHQSLSAYLVRWDRDSSMCPFECDFCVFRKMKGINRQVGKIQDNLVMGCVQQANLDAF